MRPATSLPLLLLSLVTAAAFADTLPLPRYAFPVGRQLTYSSASSFKYDGGNESNDSTVQLTVTRQNGDGSAHIIICTAATTQPDAAPSDTSYSWADVFPDGRIAASSDTMLPQSSPVLPALPKDADQLAHGWQTPGTMPEQTVSYTAASSPLGWTLTASTNGIFKRIYGITNDSTIHFDASIAAVKDIESHESQTYGFHGQGTGTIHLVTDTMISPKDAAALAARIDDYFAVTNAYQAKCDAADADPATATQVLASARAILVSAIAREKYPENKTLLQQQLSQDDQYAQFELDSYKNHAAVLNHPLPDFTASDLDGKTHSLADCHGKVLLMDFWYRGCGWCMVTMPQMKEIVADFAGKPVIVLGMNTDNDPADAKFVASAMALNYPTCKAPPDFVSKLHVQAFPSLIIVDPSGIVREFHEGYTPTLRQDIGKEIQSMLTKAG